MDVIVQLILILISLIGVFISAIGFPGTVLILVSLLIYGVYVDFSNPAPWVYITFASITLISTIADNIAVLVGAKKFGASKYGVFGAFIGGLVGFVVLPPFGIIIGPFVGAFIADLYSKKNIKMAFKGAIGTFIGYLGGIIIKSLVAVILFIWLMTIIF